MSASLADKRTIKDIKPQAAQAPDKITRERDSIERYNGLNL